MKRLHKSNRLVNAARVALACILMTQLACGAFASSVSLAWDPNSESSVAGYNVYRSTQAGTFAAPLNGGAPLQTASITDATAQGGSTYYYVVKAVNTDGLESAASNQIQVAVPTVTLSAPTGLISQCNADGKTFTIRWNAAAGAASYYVGVDYRANNSDPGAVDGWFVAGSQDLNLDPYAGTTFTGPVVMGQTYSWWVGSNGAGTVGPWTGGANFTCSDVTPPAVSITAPSVGATVSGTYAVSATASDDVAVAGVQFKLNGANLGAEDTTAPYSTSWNTTTASNGPYTLTAVARDAAGNQTTSAAVSVTVNNADKTAPTVAITAPAAAATVSGAAVTISASASDNVGVAGVQFKVNGANAGAEATTAPYSTTWNSTALSNGSYTLTAVARDAAGNQTTSAAVIVTVNNADRTAPAVSITAPAAAASVSGAAVAISASASDNIGVAGVQFRVNGANAGAEVMSAPYSTMWDTTALSNGSYTLTAVARDAAGNQTTSAAVTVTVNNADKTAPAVSITAPAAGATVSGAAVAISASASDNVGVAGVQFKVNGANAGAEVMSAPYSTMWDTTALSNGSYTLTAVARDAAGNQTTSAAVTVTVNNADKTAPWVSITAPAAGATVSGAAVTISASASDDVGVAGVQFKVNGANAGAEATSAPYSTPWNTLALSNGSYTLTAVARDAAGNQTTSAAVSVTVNNADTTVPTVSITAPAAGATLSGSVVSITASASDNVGVAGVQFKVNNVNLGVEDTTSPYSASWNPSSLPNGTYTLKAVARDAAGNQTVSAAVTVRLKKKGVAGAQIESVDQNGNAWADVALESAVTVGYARLDQEGGAMPSEGVAVITLKNGSNVVSETSVPASVPVSEGRLYVDYGGRANTGVAIANDNSEAAVISYYFTDSTGTDFGQGSFTLDAKHQRSGFVNEAPFNLTKQMKGTLTFSSSVPVGLLALRGYINERGEFLMTTLPVGSVGAASTASSVVFPHFADGSGWTTQVVLVNPMDVQMSGTVQFFGAGSANAAAKVMTMTANGVTASSFNYTIAPRSAYRLVTANASSDVRVGSVLVTRAMNSVLPQGLSIFSYSNLGITVTEAGVPAEVAGTDFRTYVESIGTVRSGLAIANSSTVPARVTFQLTTLDDVQTGMTATMDIPVNGHAAQFINELFPAIQDGFQGVLRIASSESVTVVGLRLRVNERGDLVITSMPVVDEAVPAATSDLVFPIVVHGGEYTTEFVTINR